MRIFSALNFRTLSAAFICLLLGSSAWILSGSTRPTLLFMLLVSCAAFSCAVFAVAFPRAAGIGGVRNPFAFSGFWFGALFLVLLLVQISNPSARFIQADGYSSLEFVKHIPYLPSCVENSFDRGGACNFFAQALMLLMFSAAAYAVFSKRACVLAALAVFVLSSSAMAAFAIVQKKLGAPAIYWTYEANGVFFGTFFLVNVSAAFFNAALVSSAVLFVSVKNIFKSSRLYRCFSYSALALCAVLNMAAVVVSSSKGGIASMLLILAGIFVVEVFRFFYARFSFVASVAFLGAVSFASIALAALIFFSPGGGVSDAEARFLKRDTMGSALSRVAINKVAFDVFCEYPVWGVGAGGYPYYTVPKMVSKQNSLDQKPSAAFKAHCDFLGFLVEFGIVGTSLIVCALLAAVLRAWKLRARLNNANLIAGVGVLGILFHGLVDMPLRISSTMLAFVFLVVVFISPLARRRDLYN